MMMDWFSWLSKSNLDSPLIRDYSLRLTTNELQEEDLAFFDHAFLQSMGISVAKHRTEILQLAKKTRRRSSFRSSSRPLIPLRLRPPPRIPAAAAKLTAAIKRSKNCFARYVGALGCSTASARPATWALSPARSSVRWSGAMLRRKAKVGLVEKGIRPMTADRRRESGGGGGYGLYRYSGAGGGTRWDAMFQNLKPT